MSRVATAYMRRAKFSAGRCTMTSPLRRIRAVGSPILRTLEGDPLPVGGPPRMGLVPGTARQACLPRAIGLDRGDLSDAAGRRLRKRDFPVRARKGGVVGDRSARARQSFRARASMSSLSIVATSGWPASRSLTAFPSVPSSCPLSTLPRVVMIEMVIGCMRMRCASCSAARNHSDPRSRLRL